MMVSIRLQPLPEAFGTSGGGSSTTSPLGSTGASRRGGRLTITRPTGVPPRIPAVPRPIVEQPACYLDPARPRVLGGTWTESSGEVDTVTAPVGLGLARVTVTAPKRRIDVALPDGVLIAELLPHLLRHAGEELADEGEGHGGWALRRSTGGALEPNRSLSA